MSLKISQIRTDGGTQSRAAINEATVAEYAEAMADPDTVFPPIIAYFDGREYWLADGFHRLAAWVRAGRDDIPAEIRQGDRRAAILHSVAANSAHGLRRSNDDKRRAVLTLLEDTEWSQWSNREIARRCAVGDQLVASVRADLTAFSRSEDAPQDRAYTTKHGTKAVMNTAKIGKPKAEKPKSASSATEEISDKLNETRVEPEKPAAEEIDPDAKARRALAKLTTDALIDEVIGLRADLSDAKAKNKALTVEVENLKADLAAYREDDMGRALGNAQRQARAAEGRMKEYQATAVRADRRVKMLEAENKKLRADAENQVIQL